MASFFSAARRNRNNMGSSSRSSGTGSNSNLVHVPSPVPQPPPTPSGGGRGTVSDGDYANKCRTLMTLLKDLKALGADTVFDLPKIAVIGIQSAGKSSLIEAVTGINVPRDSGTCTRCPMECSMSSAASSWSCTISLRSENFTSAVADSPSWDVMCPSPSSSASAASLAYIPVVDMPAKARTQARTNTATQQFGGRIIDKSQVELWLRRAQGAILSTDADKSKWLTKSAEDIKEAIENRTGMFEFTSDTIVVDIQDPNATDLLFVDLPGIISNAAHSSVELIKDLVRDHIAGENTLILVTMPAAVDIEVQGAVVLAKEADPYGDRTIAVLTRPDNIGDGDTGSLQKWKQIFENPKVLNNRHYLQHGYYGVRLPNDEERAQGHSAHSLPDYFKVTKPWSDLSDRKRFGVNNLVRDISALLVQMIETNLPGLRTAIEAASKHCFDRLSKLPSVVSHENEMSSIILLINAFLREIESASLGETHQDLAQTCRMRYNHLRDEVERTCPRFEHTNTVGGGVYGVQDVKAVIENCTGWELPGVIPYDAYKTFIKLFLEEWKNPVERCFEDIYNNFSSFIVNLSNSQFSRLPHLNSLVLRHVRSELQKSRTLTEASVLKLLEIEKQRYFSQRAHFRIEQEKWMQYYGRNFYPHEEISRHYQLREEIHVMATVRTYFQLAFERFTDMLLLTQEHDLVQSLPPKLEEALFKEVTMLGTKSGALKHLLAEDEDIEREREELRNRSARLEDMRNRLDAYGTS